MPTASPEWYLITRFVYDKHVVILLVVSHLTINIYNVVLIWV